MRRREGELICANHDRESAVPGRGPASALSVAGSLGVLEEREQACVEGNVATHHVENSGKLIQTRMPKEVTETASRARKFQQIDLMAFVETTADRKD